MFIRLSVFVLLWVSLTTHAATLLAEARSSTEQTAKREALAALADSILVEVKSEITSNVKGTGERQDEHKISSRSDIPLIGVDLSCMPLRNEVRCEARLDSGKSLRVYTSKLDDLRREVDDLDTRIGKTEESNRYPQLVQLLTLSEQYEKYRAVAQMLGATQFTPPAKTRSNIEAQLRALEKLIPNLDVAAQVIAKNLSSDAVFIYAAMPLGSHEVTALGRVLRDKLAQHLKSATSPEQATRYLKGEYEILDNSIHLTYRLLDDAGNTLTTRIASLAPAAYQGLQTTPTTINFDRLLHEGMLQNNDFRAQLNSNHGSESVLFNEKDEVELFVKINRPGYFYVVGHVVKKTENYSYLLELSQAERDRRFVRYANADDANKWLSIGRFETTPPFGIESLQLIASSDDPIHRLPSHQLDKRTELYITASKAQQGIAKTRALKPKRVEADRQYQSEAVLMFTTMQK